MRRESLLFANDRFYLAFGNGDFPAMAELWAQHAQLICIHPGWPALTDRSSILSSWQRILGGEEPPEIHHDNARVFDFGAIACVVCYESVGGNRLVATNGFIEEDGEPRMVLHQAGACAEAPHPEPGVTPPLQ